MQKDKFGHGGGGGGGGGTSVKLLLFSVLNRVFNPYFLIGTFTFPMRNTLLRIIQG